MPLEIKIDLQPKQKRLFQLLKAKGSEAATHLGYGGARGGAKSGGAQRCAVGLALTEPHIAVMIFRRTFEVLKENHIDKILDTWPELREYYGSTAKEITLPNRTVIRFRHAETAQELLRKSRGMEAKYHFIDQAEELTEEELKRLKIANRWPGTDDAECKTVHMFNPGGPGTEYLRRIYYLKKYQDRERPTDYDFIQAYGWDNYEWLRGTGLVTRGDFYRLSDEERFALFVNHSDYGRKMNALPESLRMGELLGRFDAFAGQYFAGVWDESKVVLTMDQVMALSQPWWTRWMSGDWGFAHHASHAWFTTGKVGPADFERVFGIPCEWPVDVVVKYRELIVSEMPETDLAEQVCQMTGSEKISAHYYSPDTFAKRGSANTIAETMSDIFLRHKLPPLDMADNDRVGGWRLMYEGFRQTCSLLSAPKITKEMAQRGPCLFISANCPQTISALPILVRDPKNLEDVLKVNTMADDIADGDRYGYKSFLEPRKKPLSVERAEIAAAAPNPTALHMAMLAFNERNRGRVRGRQGWQN